MPEFGFSRIKSGKIEPLKDNSYDIGDVTLKWKDGRFSGTVYASRFEGSIDWSYVVNKPLIGIPLAIDDTEYSVTGTTETEAKYFRFYKSTNVPIKILRLVLSAYSSEGNGTIKVYIDGAEEVSISVTTTSETPYERDIDISGLADGLHTVSIKLVGGSATETVATIYLLALGVV